MFKMKKINFVLLPPYHHASQTDQLILIKIDEIIDKLIKITKKMDDSSDFADDDWGKILSDLQTMSKEISGE